MHSRHGISVDCATPGLPRELIWMTYQSHFRESQNSNREEYPPQTAEADTRPVNQRQEIRG
jgi:hypothetical protein